MAENSKISWTDHTFNPWIGCTKISAGCANCYAAADHKFKQYFGPTAERHITSDNYWKQPLTWNKKAETEGVRYKVFCGSMCDVFEDREELISRRGALWGRIVATPHLDWLLLTKRPGNIIPLVPKDLFSQEPFIPFNVWIGVSVENQEQADKRIPELLKIPAKVRFLSCEPLLGQIDLSHYLMMDEENTTSGFYEKHGWGYDEYSGGSIGRGDIPYDPRPGIDWLIAGGESGSIRREMLPLDILYLQWQCEKANIPFFCKQDSAQKPGQQGRIPDWLWNIKEFPNAQ